MNIIDGKLNERLKEIKDKIEHEKDNIATEFIDYYHESISTDFVQNKTREETYHYYITSIEKYKNELLNENDPNKTKEILNKLTNLNDFVSDYEEKKREKEQEKNAKLDELINVKRYNLIALTVKQSIKEDYEELLDKKSELESKINENNNLIFSSNDNLEELGKKDRKLRKEYFALRTELKELKDLYIFDGRVINTDDEKRFLNGSESAQEYYKIINKYGLNLSKVELTNEQDFEIEDKDIDNKSILEEKDNNNDFINVENEKDMDVSTKDTTKKVEPNNELEEGLTVIEEPENNDVKDIAPNDELAVVDEMDEELELKEPEIMIPENLKQKPKLTWKTVSAVAAGALAVGGCYAAFGIGAMGVTLAASAIGRRFIKKKEKKIKTKEEEIEKLINEANELINKNNMIKEQFIENKYVERLNNIFNIIIDLIPDDMKEDFANQVKINPFEAIQSLPEDIYEQIKNEYPNEIELVDEVANLFQEYNNNQLRIDEIKETCAQYYSEIYPDLKNDNRFKTPEKINNLTDAKEYLKAKGRKFKAYLGSKEGLRDCRWFCNSAMITSIGITLGHGINSMLNKPEGLEATNPVDKIHSDPVNPTPEPDLGNDVLFSDIKEGAGIGDYNVSVGHDTAGWAVNGENAENLISQYVNAENTVFKRFGMFDGEKYIPIDLGGKSLGEYIATTGIDPSKIAVGVADKSNLIDQAWLSLEELTKGIGRSM